MAVTPHDAASCIDLSVAAADMARTSNADCTPLFLTGVVCPG